MSVDPFYALFDPFQTFGPATQCSRTPRPASSSGSGAEDFLARICPITHRGLGCRGFLHRRSLDLRRAHHLLLAGVHASRVSSGLYRGDDALTGPRMDETNGPEHDNGGHRVPVWLSVSATRSRYKVLRSVRRDPPGRRYQSGDIATAESKSERPLRTLDSICKDGAPVENDSFRRKLSPPLP